MAAILLLIPLLALPARVWHGHHVADAVANTVDSHGHAHDDHSHDPADSPTPHQPHPEQCQGCWLATMAVDLPVALTISAPLTQARARFAEPSVAVIVSTKLPITGRGPPAIA